MVEIAAGSANLAFSSIFVHRFHPPRPCLAHGQQFRYFPQQTAEWGTSANGGKLKELEKQNAS
jgi:hypothetical protein